MKYMMKADCYDDDSEEELMIAHGGKSLRKVR